jgi:hypothetical protein
MTAASMTPAAASKRIGADPRPVITKKIRLIRDPRTPIRDYGNGMAVSESTPSVRERISAR